MACFVWLSGASYALSRKINFDSLVVNRARRLLVPYYLAGIFFMFPLKYIAGYFNNGNIKLALTVFVSGGENGQLWFLLALFWCCIISAFLIKSFLKKVW